ncbi:MAG: hypothetical protein WAP74_02990 [Patescibacteria group bacterium]
MNAVSRSGGTRTKAECWAGIFRVMGVLLLIGTVLGLIWWHAWYLRVRTDQAYAAGKRAGDDQGHAIGYELGEAEGLEAGELEGLGKPKPLTKLEHYRFHSAFEDGKKQYALLKPPDSLNYQLYELDIKMFPNGFPERGGILEPVQVDGYFKPSAPPVKPARKSKARRTRPLVRPMSPAGMGKITRKSSRAHLPNDWPMCLPALPPARFGK